MRGRRFDVASIVSSFDADIVVVPESWSSDTGESILDPLRDEGYAIETVDMMKLARRTTTNRFAVPRDGIWQLALCSRFPIVARRDLPIGRIQTDPAGKRLALACTLDVHGEPLEIVALHTSSKLWWLGPVRHMLALKRRLRTAGMKPDIIAGDFNFWGPPVSVLFRGWRRAVRGPTYPANRPHSQIDHVLVRGNIEAVSGEVLAATPSDHRPIRVNLRH